MSAVMRLSGECPECGGVLVRRENRRDQSFFVGCDRFPRCKFTEDFDSEVQALADENAELREWIAHLQGRVRDLDAQLSATTSSPKPKRRRRTRVIVVDAPTDSVPPEDSN